MPHSDCLRVLRVSTLNIRKIAMRVTFTIRVQPQPALIAVTPMNKGIEVAYEGMRVKL